MTLLLLALTWASVCVLPGNAQNDHIGIKVGLNVGGQPPAPGGKSGPPALIDIDAAILISWCNVSIHPAVAHDDFDMKLILAL